MKVGREWRLHQAAPETTETTDMNKIIMSTAATIAAIMLSTSAIAVEIENQDGQDYKVNTWERKDAKLIIKSKKLQPRG